MRVIVTGGAGFVGTLLARRLLGGPVGSAGTPSTWMSWCWPTWRRLRRTWRPTRACAR